MLFNVSASPHRTVEPQVIEADDEKDAAFQAAVIWGWATPDEKDARNFRVRGSYYQGENPCIIVTPVEGWEDIREG